MFDFFCCPTRVRTWTLLIQSQSCCQLHHWALNSAAKIRPFFIRATESVIFFFGFFYSVLFRLPLTVPSKASVPDTNTKLTSPEPVQLPLS